jgi:hypothetical protein
MLNTAIKPNAVTKIISNEFGIKTPKCSSQISIHHSDDINSDNAQKVFDRLVNNKPTSTDSKLTLRLDTIV